MHMLRRHNFDYLLGGDFGHLGDKATSFRKILEGSILATDMSRHFGFVNQLTELGKKYGGKLAASKNIEEDRLLLCAGLIKCADISNPVSLLDDCVTFRWHVLTILILYRHDLIESQVLGLQLFSTNGTYKLL